MDNFDDWHDERTPLFVASVAAFAGLELPAEVFASPSYRRDEDEEDEAA
jgi:hypothetical protein